MSKTLLLTLGFICLGVSMLTVPAHAQYGTLPIGTLTASQNSVTCPGNGWYKYNGQYVTCYSATVSGCGAGVESLGLTFGYLDPLNILRLSADKGVIILLSGQGGTTPAGDDVGVTDGDFAFADYYFKQGYVIVELEWDSDWEDTQNPFPVTPVTYGNVQLAACRPATFFNYIFNTYYQPIFNTNATAGMCGHGFSAGSAALAYSMAYYKASTPWWFDNLELLAGPAVTDMEQGCTKPIAEPISVCPAGQWGCPTGVTSWLSGPTFVGPAANWVGGWTNDTTCANPNVTQTTSTSDQSWAQQSIVDDGTNNPVFSYPHTAMAGWLCKSLSNQQNQSCYTNYNWKTCPNESSAQGQSYFRNFTQTNSPGAYSLNPVDGCNGPEGVAAGTVASTGTGGLVAVEQDMAGPNVPFGPRCVHN